MASPTNDCPSIEANPDVSGIGIRISFYINTILIAAIPRHPPFHKLLAPLQTNSGLNGLALLVTAIAQSARTDLTLYHAIICIHMLLFLGIATSTTGHYNTTQSRFRVYAATSWCSNVVFYYFTIMVWATAPRYGEQVQCNDSTIYVLWFANVRATSNWLRWLIVTLMSLSAFIFLINTTRQLILLIKSASISSSASSASSDTPGFFSRLLPNLGQPRRRSQGVIARTFAGIYSVIMLELTIRRNPSSDEENVWSFGQIISLLITLSTLNEVLHFLLGEDLGLNIGSTAHRFLSLVGLRRARPQQTDPHPKGNDIELGNGNSDAINPEHNATQEAESKNPTSQPVNMYR